MYKRNFFTLLGILKDAVREANDKYKADIDAAARARFAEQDDDDEDDEEELVDLDSKAKDGDK